MPLLNGNDSYGSNYRKLKIILGIIPSNSYDIKCNEHIFKNIFGMILAIMIVIIMIIVMFGIMVFIIVITLRIMIMVKVNAKNISLSLLLHHLHRVFGFYCCRSYEIYTVYIL